MSEVGDIGGRPGFGPISGHSKQEPTFHEPWEGRAFGVAVALTHAGRYQWREFKRVFVEHIARAESSGEPSTYYQRWLAALEELALAKGLDSATGLEQRAQRLAAEVGHWSGPPGISRPRSLTK